MLPVYCNSCKRYLGEDDEHDDFCPVEIEKQRAAARWRPKGEASFKEMALAYAIFVVLLGAAAIVWFKFL